MPSRKRHNKKGGMVEEEKGMVEEEKKENETPEMVAAARARIPSSVEQPPVARLRREERLWQRDNYTPIDSEESFYDQLQESNINFKDKTGFEVTMTKIPNYNFNLSLTTPTLYDYLSRLILGKADHNIADTIGLPVPNHLLDSLSKYGFIGRNEEGKSLVAYDVFKMNNNLDTTAIINSIDYSKLCKVNNVSYSVSEKNDEIRGRLNEVFRNLLRSLLIPIRSNLDVINLNRILSMSVRKIILTFIKNFIREIQGNILFINKVKFDTDTPSIDRALATCIIYQRIVSLVMKHYPNNRIYILCIIMNIVASSDSVIQYIQNFIDNTNGDSIPPISAPNNSVDQNKRKKLNTIMPFINKQFMPIQGHPFEYYFNHSNGHVIQTITNITIDETSVLVTNVQLLQIQSTLINDFNNSLGFVLIESVADIKNNTYNINVQFRWTFQITNTFMDYDNDQDVDPAYTRYLSDIQENYDTNEKRKKISLGKVEAASPTPSTPALNKTIVGITGLAVLGAGAAIAASFLLGGKGRRTKRRVYRSSRRTRTRTRTRRRVYRSSRRTRRK